MMLITRLFSLDQDGYHTVPVSTKLKFIALGLSLALAAGCGKPAETAGQQPERQESSAMVETIAEYFSPQGKEVTAADYPTAESSRQFLEKQSAVGVNNFLHLRELTPTDKQTVVRMNRDTYYSLAVVDVSKGATLTLPEVPEGKYLSAQIVTENHRPYPMFYGAGDHELTTHTGNHVFVIVRLDATFSQEEANAIQDQMRITANSANPFKAEPVDEASFREVEEALKARMLDIVERDGVNALVGCFTSPNDASNELFTQEKYEACAAVGWGGAQIVDNIYELSGAYPADVCHQATFEDPGNAAFWSVTVYNGEGFMFNDVANASSDTATPNDDGTFTVSFGCGPDAPNNIPTANESGVFTLTMRHYRPSQRVIDGYRIVPTVKAVK